MNKIFYRPETLEIMGMSDGNNSMDFPFVVTDIGYHSLENLQVVKRGKSVKLMVKRGGLGEPPMEIPIDEPIS